MTTHTFENEEQFEHFVIRRARAVLGMQGWKNVGPVCINAARGKFKQEMTDDEVAKIAREIADDTTFHDGRWTTR